MRRLCITWVMRCLDNGKILRLSVSLSRLQNWKPILSGSRRPSIILGWFVKVRSSLPKPLRLIRSHCEIILLMMRPDIIWNSVNVSRNNSRTNRTSRIKTTKIIKTRKIKRISRSKIKTRKISKSRTSSNNNRTNSR